MVMAVAGQDVHVGSHVEKAISAHVKVTFRR
jgi:hypothetical protein